MRRTDISDFPPMPPPNPWLMAAVLIGSGVTLWCLTPAAVRREKAESQEDGGRWSTFADWASGVRAYYSMSTRSAGILMFVSGLVVLGIQIAQA